MRHIAPLGPESMEFARQIIQVKRDSVWLMCERRRLDDAREQRDLPDQAQFDRIIETLDFRIAQECNARLGIIRQ
jgi:hypothetical protein